MTDQAPDHSVFDELAAGYAVHALEPADEERFLRHAGQCRRCRRSVAEFGDVAEALAETTPPAEPRAELGDRILAMALADLGQQDPLASLIPGDSTPGAGTPAAGADHPRGAPKGAGESRAVAPEDSPTATVVPLRQRRARWRKPAAAAAAAALIVGGGIWAGLAAAPGSSSPPLAVCAHPHACTEIVLTASATGRPAAKVIIHDGQVWMEPVGMAANPSDEIYVLWQITGAHTPLAVGSFDIRRGAQSPIRIGGLAAAYSRTWAFAVSLEHGRTIPARPSHPVALGQVS